jgi:UDP-2,4-diacetamido-2,4,6-trideoxy-beta-L-altropyranose hydrolase
MVICAEANSQVGVGHVMRCMALAQVWNTQGNRCVFFGGIEAGSLRERMIADGCELVEPSPDPGDTVRRLNDMDINNAWVVLDGYHLGPEWQDVLVDSGFAVLCIDDGARLPRYRAQVIVSPDCDARPLSFETPPSTLILAGPRYRLLRQGMAENTARPAIDGTKRAVLVAFGGADTRNVTLDVVKALDGILSPEDRAIVVLGPANRHRVVVEDALKAVAYQSELLQDVADMAAIYARADLAISAAGGAAWEMAASGLPAVLVPVAANQLPGAGFLADAGAALRVDDPTAIAGEGFAAQVRDLLADRPRLAAMASAGRLVCDGKGAHRVLGILSALEQGLKGNAYCLRRAVPDDMEQLLRLANDPDVRASSFSPAPIALEDHARWFAARIESPDTAIFVLDLEGVVAAMVRYDRVAEDAEIDIAVHNAFRGRGLGVHILQASASAAMRSLAVPLLRAVVLERNLASRNCFIKAGFSEVGTEHVKGNDCRVFIRHAGQGESDENA